MNMKTSPQLTPNSLAVCVTFPLTWSRYSMAEISYLTLHEYTRGISLLCKWWKDWADDAVCSKLVTSEFSTERKQRVGSYQVLYIPCAKKLAKSRGWALYKVMDAYSVLYSIIKNSGRSDDFWKLKTIMKIFNVLGILIRFTSLHRK